MPKYSTGFLGCLVSGVSTPMSLTFSPVFKMIVSPSTTLVHLRVWELEQEAVTNIDRNAVAKIRARIFGGLILLSDIQFSYHKKDRG